GGKEFAAKYKNRYNQDIGLYTPYFYDGVMVIAAAMKAANSTDPAKYLPALAKLKYPGVTADIEFDNNGDLTKGLLTIFEVKKGKWEVVGKEDLWVLERSVECSHFRCGVGPSSAKSRHRPTPPARGPVARAVRRHKPSADNPGWSSGLLPSAQ